MTLELRNSLQGSANNLTPFKGGGGGGEKSDGGVWKTQKWTT